MKEIGLLLYQVNHDFYQTLEAIEKTIRVVVSSHQISRNNDDAKYDNFILLLALVLSVTIGL